MKANKIFKVGKEFSWIGSNFKEWFGDMDFKKKKTEPLISQKLPRNMNDSEILAELKPTEVTLDEVYSTLQTMDKSWWAIFYVKDVSGVLRTVNANWCGGGWGVGADGVANPGRWGDSSQVFSRNPFGTQSLILSSSDTLSLESRVKSLEEQMESLRKFLVF